VADTHSKRWPEQQFPEKPDQQTRQPCETVYRVSTGGRNGAARWEPCSGICRVDDGIRTAVHKADPDRNNNGWKNQFFESLLETEFTNCSCRERERERDGAEGTMAG
jgi:hypothetical protein